MNVEQTAAQRRRRHGRLGHRRMWLAAFVAIAAALALLWALPAPPWGTSDVVETSTEADISGFNPSLEAGLVIGDVAQLPDGAVARVNSVRPDVTLPPGHPGPERGTKLVRLDVELCAGTPELFVDAAFWLGLGGDDAVYSAHMGVRDLLTMTMAPGSCQRGNVDLAMPEQIALREVLLSDTTHATVARWSVAGQPGALEPLSPAVTSETAAVGSAADLVGGGVTLHAVTEDPNPLGAGEGSDPDRTLFRIDGEVCAGQQRLPASPRYWFVQLEDHRLVAAERDGSTMLTGDLDPGACDRGTADFSLPAGAHVVAVVHASGGIFEEARWHVDP